MINKKIVMLLAKDAIKTDARALTEIKSLQKKGYIVSCILWSRKRTNNIYEKYKDIYIKRINLTLPCNNKYFIMLFLFFFNIIIFIELLKKEYDIIHCHDFDTLIGGLLASKIKNKKIIYDAHEIYPLMVYDIMPYFYSRIMSLIELYLMEQVDVIITVSHIFKKYYKDLGIRKPISVIMNCKSKNNFLISDDEILSLKNNLHICNKFTILYDGWLIPHNGLEVLFESIKNVTKIHQDIMVILCGDGYLNEYYKEMVNSLKINNYVTFIGKVESNDIPKYVAVCDVMYVVYNKTNVYSSFRTPVRLYESIISNKIIIGSNHGVVNYIIKTENIGITINPEDSLELTNVIIKLKSNKKLKKRIIKNIKKIQQYYNWDLVEKQLLLIYQNL